MTGIQHSIPFIRQDDVCPVDLSKPRQTPHPSLVCSYSTTAAATVLQDDQVIALISPAGECIPGTDPRHYFCGLTVLDGEPMHEVWRANSPVSRGVEGALHWSQSEEVMFTACWIGEHDADFTPAVREAYVNLLRLVNQRGYPHIARAWNYMPHINRGTGDEERYRQFCLGRQQAFKDFLPGELAFPAACALGHSGKNTVIYLLATKSELTHIENPRQKSAYHYPRQYGPASPSFARASLVNWREGSQLLVSGTASIVGHESRHANNLEGQLETTLDNLQALLTCSADLDNCEAPHFELLKAYIRHPEHAEAVRQKLEARFGEIPTLYLQADICRSELLVEIDGICALQNLEATNTVPVATSA